MLLRKRCQKCSEWTSMTDFEKDENHFDGRSKYCKKCVEKKEEEPEVVEYTKNIEQVDKETLEIIAVFKTPILAGEALDKNPMSIRSCLRGKSKSAYGFLWQYQKK